MCKWVCWGVKMLHVLIIKAKSVKEWHDVSIFLCFVLLVHLSWESIWGVDVAPCFIPTVSLDLLWSMLLVMSIRHDLFVCWRLPQFGMVSWSWCLGNQDLVQNSGLLLSTLWYRSRFLLGLAQICPGMQLYWPLFTNCRLLSGCGILPIGWTRPPLRLAKYRGKEVHILVNRAPWLLRRG